MSCSSVRARKRTHLPQLRMIRRTVFRALTIQNSQNKVLSTKAGPPCKVSRWAFSINNRVTWWFIGRITWCFSDSDSVEFCSLPPTLSKPSLSRYGVSRRIELERGNFSLFFNARISPGKASIWTSLNTPIRPAWISTAVSPDRLRSFDDNREFLIKRKT